MTFERPGREAREVAWLWSAAALSAAILAPLVLAMEPYAPGCPFRLITGVPCPSCGMTRAGLALLHLDPLAALSWNPLGALAEVAFLGGGLLAPLWVHAGWRVPVLPHPLPLWARLAAVAALLANWAWVVVRLR